MPELIAQLKRHAEHRFDLGIPPMLEYNPHPTKEKETKMARQLTVKVATPKVINALETKLETIKANYANQETLEAKFQEELKAWNKSLTDYAFSKIDSATNIRTNYRQWSNSLNIDFDVITDKDFPAQPTRNFTTMAQYEYTNTCEEISNALNILRMTEDEYVNASTMKSIAQYL